MNSKTLPMGAMIVGMTFVVSVAIFGVPTFAADTYDRACDLHKTGPGMGGRAHRIMRLMHDLDMTREQRDQIADITDANRRSMRDAMFDMMDAKKTLQSILTTGNYDAGQVEKLAAQQAQHAEKMILTTAKMYADVSAVLSEEQRDRLAEKMKTRSHGWRDYHRGGF